MLVSKNRFGKQQTSELSNFQSKNRKINKFLTKQNFSNQEENMFSLIVTYLRYVGVFRFQKKTSYQTKYQKLAKFLHLGSQNCNRKKKKLTEKLKLH